MQLRLNKRIILPVITVLSLLSVGIVWAITTQTFPPVTIPAAVSTITANCTTLTLETVPTPLSGTLEFDCGTAGPGFLATAGTSTPTFALPTGYTSLTLTIAGTGCSSPATQVPLTSGVDVSLAANSYNYCAAYATPNGGATIPTFTITWP